MRLASVLALTAVAAVATVSSRGQLRVLPATTRAVVVQWTVTPDPLISGFKVYVGTSNASPGQVTSVTRLPASARFAAICDAPLGAVVTVSVLGTNGLESALSSPLPTQ